VMTLANDDESQVEYCVGSFVSLGQSLEGLFDALDFVSQALLELQLAHFVLADELAVAAG
jgi:hypothetical protein